MTNYTPKKICKQPKNNRAQLIEAAKSDWLEQARLLLEEKNVLGYQDFTWDAFLQIVPDDSFDLAKQSAIFTMQEKHKELLKQQQIIWAEDLVVDDLNKHHAIVHIDQTYVLTEKKNSLGGNDFSLESRQSFRAFYEDETVLCLDGIERCKADIWLKSPRRRKYKRIVFDPTSTEFNYEYYNLWKGFTRQPVKGSCEKYWHHVVHNICSSNKDNFMYVKKWLAYVFQRPNQVHTAIVLCGSQGVGKNSFVEPLGVLLGAHYAPLSSIAELVSNFNYHLKNAVLIHANEALWGGNKKDIGTVKAMITEKTCLIEGKGKDRVVVNNFKHVILSSNEDWPVHLDRDDRRFFVLNISERHKEDHCYFRAIQEELDQGGYEALLYDLLNENLDGFNPRSLPNSADSFDIKMRSADSRERYLYEVLQLGGFSIGKTNDSESPVWQSEVPKQSVYDDYVAWCRASNEEVYSKELFGRTLKKIFMVDEVRPSHGGSRVRCYKFQSLNKSREDFCKAFKQAVETIFVDN